MRTTRSFFPISLIKTAFLLIILAVPVHAQTTNTAEVLKAVWIYKFLNYIEWPNEEDTEVITISYWGDDEGFYKNLSALNGKEVRDSRIEVTRQNNITPKATVQVIVVGKNKNSSLPKLHSLLNGKSTLVISDAAENKQSIMINFVYPDPNTISFELNRYNIIYEKLSLSSEILVIGGTEIDIAKVLNEMNTKLDDTNIQLDKQKKALKKLSIERAQEENKIAKQTQEINKKRLQYALLKKEMDELILTLKNSHEELANNTEALNVKHNNLIEKESEIERLSQAISDKSLTLEKQSQQITRQEKNLLNLKASFVNQEKELNSKSSTIRQQNIVMLLSFAFMVLALGIVFVLYKNSQNKKKSYKALSDKNIELAQTNEQLINTQSQLVESEKMAALGSLVAGVAHEINTPLGISVTAASTAQDLLDAFMISVRENKVSRTGMNKFLEQLSKTIGLMTSTLVRSGDLIRQFKLVAVDQSSEEIREFLLCEYLHEVVSSLYPQYKSYHCEIDVQCDAEIKMHSYPGGIAQIITNLMMNSLLHGFNIEKEMLIQLLVKMENNHVTLTYQDNGIGIDKDKYAQIFTPFYTTKRSEGGSGLGLHICYNIASKLGGDIICVPCDSGAKFILTMPKDIT